MLGHEPSVTDDNNPKKQIYKSDRLQYYVNWRNTCKGYVQFSWMHSSCLICRNFFSSSRKLYGFLKDVII